MSLKDFTTQIEEWEKALGLKINLNYEILCQIQSLTKTELDNLSAKEAANYVFILQQFAFDIQKHYNKCDAFLYWAKNNRNIQKSNLIELCETKKRYIFFL